MIICKVKKSADLGEYPHMTMVPSKDVALVIANFLNTIGGSQEPLELGDNWNSAEHRLWISDAEYKALLDNAELLGIEFIVEGS